jgi:hypothetical protein
VGGGAALWSRRWAAASDGFPFRGGQRAAWWLEKHVGQGLLGQEEAVRGQVGPWPEHANQGLPFRASACASLQLAAEEQGIEHEIEHGFEGGSGEN